MSKALQDILKREGLSTKESEVADLVAKGFTNREISDRLMLTEKTIKYYLTNIYKKLELSSRAQLITYCFSFVEDEIKKQSIDTTITPTDQDTKRDMGSPVLGYTFDKLYINGEHLSKREYFAGLAMQGLISQEYHEFGDGHIDPKLGVTIVADWSVKMSDALIEALEKDK